MSDKAHMDSFQTLVSACREKNKDTLINNAAWDHAMFLFYNLLDVAVERNAQVRIVTGSMKDKFYCDAGILKRFDRLIEKNIPISVIVVGAPELSIKDHACASKIQEYSKGDIIVAKEPIPAPHMLLIGDDARAFRFETDHNQTKAVASFNNPEMGDVLNTFYELAVCMATGKAPSKELIAA